MDEIIRLVQEFTAARDTLQRLQDEKDVLVDTREKLRLKLDDVNARIAEAQAVVTAKRAELKAAL